MSSIIPAILARSPYAFKRFVEKARGFGASMVHLDVMDGVFVPNHSFPERQEINDLNLRLKYELHLMVADPIAEMKTWAGVKNVTPPARIKRVFAVTSEIKGLGQNFHCT